VKYQCIVRRNRQDALEQGGQQLKRVVNLATAYKTVLNKVKFTRSSLSSDLSDQSEEMEKSWSFAEVIGTGIFYQDNHQHAHLVLDLPPPKSRQSV
jgi:hypothetical protein